MFKFLASLLLVFLPVVIFAQAKETRKINLASECEREGEAPSPRSGVEGATRAPSKEKEILLWKVPAGGSKALLPDISLVGSFAGAVFRNEPVGDQGENPSQTGFNLQGMELGLQSVIDPYVRGDIFILFQRRTAEVEEGTITTTSLPLNLQAKAGALLAKFGRENPRHLEQLNFVDTSFNNRYFFGADGFHELGVEVSELLPLPWFSETAFQFLQGENGGNFDGGRKQDFAYLGHWTNGFDVTNNLAGQLGLSGAFGFNDAGRGNGTQIYGSDLYFRWRPSERRGMKWQTEYIIRRREELAATRLEGGLSSEVTFQFARRWEGGVRYSQIGMPKEIFGRKALSTDLTFLETEFFKLRAQYNFVKTDGALQNQHEAFLQMQFNMGPHGAHSF